MEEFPTCPQRDLLWKKINICMTNSDNFYGVFNKRTSTYSQIDDGSTPLTTFSTIEEAKSYFLTDAALAVYNECCTQLQWALVGTTGLKKTMAFGTKGGQITPADDWAEQYNSRKTALISAKNWQRNPHLTQESDSHLF